MNSLLEKEGMAGHVQMVYIDPPYGIKYGSNFQPFTNKRDPKDGKDDDLTQEPETLKAFRDTWELGIHSYLSYMRDRLLLAKELLHESGSVFVQISDQNVHLLRCLLDDVFGPTNFRSLIGFRTTTGKASSEIDTTFDFLIWYSKSGEFRFHRPYVPRSYQDDYNLCWIEWEDGKKEKLSTGKEIQDAIDKGGRLFRPNPLTAQTASETTVFPYEFGNRKFSPKKGGWKTNVDGMGVLEAKRRLMVVGNTLCFVRYLDDFPFRPVNNIWDDTRQSGFADPKKYVVQTAARVIQRCLLMTTDPGDLVFDPTCGSGTTAYVAEQWGRRWITCDTSRVAVTLARQRLMTALFDYYKLAQPSEGVGSGFNYKTVPHVTLKSITNDEPPTPETIYDRPLPDNSKLRVTGPFTVEAVPAPGVKSLEEFESEGTTSQAPADTSITRSGETLRQSEWRDELLKAGIRGKGGQKISFSRVEALPGTRWLHADAETIESEAQPAQRVAISFGPEHQPLEQRQVALALEEAQQLIPNPKMVVFAAFEFDPEAAKDIDETDWPGVALLKAKMNGDLFTEDLRKKRSSNESFWLVGQPDVRSKKGDNDQFTVEVFGFDYYNTKTGTIESGGPNNIAMWMLDPDYDGRSLFPRQVFFPMSGEKEGWARLAKNLKAEIDPELIERYHGTVSLPFAAGERRRAAVKIVDDRGIESLKLMDLD